MGLNNTIARKFQDAFENKCYKLITKAFANAKAENIVELEWDENDITSELHKHIDKDPQRLKWKIVTNVEQHLPKENIEKKKGFAAKFPRIDLRLSTFSSSQEYKYHLEAKNLREKDSHLKRRYINTGIDNFISGKYFNGSLIGYLLEGTVESTIEGINFLLKKDNRESEFLTSKEIILHSSYYESNHIEIGVLKHLVFDFTNN